MNLLITFLRILGVVFLTWVARRFIGFLVGRLKNKVAESSLETAEHRQKRLATLSSLIVTSSNILLGLAAMIIILSELGVNIMPLLTGVGVLGLGVGMGAKSLVSDVVAGFFILLENQFNIGDQVLLGGKWSGKVKEITLRTVILVDKENKRKIIPNSSINTVVVYPEEEEA